MQHHLYQQFRIIDLDYRKILDLIRVTRPIKPQVGAMQQGIVLCPSGPVSNEDIWHAFERNRESSVITGSRRGTQQVNTIVIDHLYQGRPLSQIPCASVANSKPIFPHCHMKVIFIKNHDKEARVVNGQEATIIASQNNTNPATTRRAVSLSTPWCTWSMTS